MDQSVRTFDRVINFTHNLGSREDYATAIVATMLKESPSFMTKFFKKFLGTSPGGWKRIGTYDVLTSCTLKDEGSWARRKKKKLKLKPDIWVFDTSPEVETKNTINLFIEGKFLSDLTKDQKKDYPKLRANSELGGPTWTYTLLICPPNKRKTYRKRYRKHFSNVISWLDVIEFASENAASTSRSTTIKTLTNLLKLEFTPLEEGSLEKKKLEQPKDRYELLGRLRRKLASQLGFSAEKERNNDSKETQKEFLSSAWLFFGKARHGLVALRFYFTNKYELKARFEIWNKDDENCEEDFKPFPRKFTKKNWIDFVFWVEEQEARLKAKYEYKRRT